MSDLRLEAGYVKVRPRSNLLFSRRKAWYWERYLESQSRSVRRDAQMQESSAAKPVALPNRSITQPIDLDNFTALSSKVPFVLASSQEPNTDNRNLTSHSSVWDLRRLGNGTYGPPIGSSARSMSWATRFDSGKKLSHTTRGVVWSECDT